MSQEEAQEVTSPALDMGGDDDAMDDDFTDQLNKEINITSDGGVKKTILVKGEGWEKPETGDIVRVHYVGTLASDGSKFDSSRDRDDPFTFTLGQGQVIKGWDLGVASMKKGEKAVLACSAPYAYGESGSPPKIPPGATLHFEVELLGWQSVKDIAGDGGVIKSVVAEGEGWAKPDDRDEVAVRYTARVQGADAPFAQVGEGDAPDTFTVSQGGRLGIKAVSVAVKSMKKGEVARLVVKPEYGYGEAGRPEAGVPPNATLEVELALAHISKVEDVTDDGAVTKKTVAESSEWKRPNEGAKVTLRGRALLGDGTVFEEWGEGGELTFTTDEEMVCEGLDQGVMKMKKGEKAVITVPPQYAYGEAGHAGRLAAVPPGATVAFEVELVDHENAKDSWEMSDAEKVAAAAAKKEKGNAAYKADKVARAVRCWDKAVSTIAYDKSYPEDVKAASRDIRRSCWLNLAAAHLKAGAWKAAIASCDKVLEGDSHHVKALYRRAQALAGQGDLYEAECDVKKGLAAEPGNADLKALAARLRAQSKEVAKKEAALYSKMFKFPKASATPAAAPGNGGDAAADQAAAPAAETPAPAVVEAQ
mmetsp:Transcript_11683/g.28662  ORF Transcript_11683/g.28662 Transcript_11683/m.28662 type:complete len:590 (-) Transcript_11683:389-2158(-)